MWSGPVSSFDSAILYWLNGLVGHSAAFDKIVSYLVGSNLKGAVFVSLFWWCWFRRTEAGASQRDREHVITTFFAGLVAIVVARVLAHTLPFRVRPRFEPTLHLLIPADNPSSLVDWSSFPSDHAVMFAALTVGLWFISRRAGLIGAACTLFIVCLPRVYVGIHYPTDILAGLALGAMIGYTFNVMAVCSRMSNWTLGWERVAPGFFYTALFMASFEFSTMFDSLREVAVQVEQFGAHLVALR